PLRDAAAGALWRQCHMPRIVCDVQYQRRSRRPGGVARQGAGIFCMTADPTKTGSDTPVDEFANEEDLMKVAEKSPENASISGSSALPQEELTRLTDDIIAGLKSVYDPEIPAD